MEHVNYLEYSVTLTNFNKEYIIIEIYSLFVESFSNIN